MFGLLAFFLFYSLASFGAVSPYSWYLLSILWLAGSGIWFAIQAIRRQTLNCSILLTCIIIFLLFVLLPARTALGFSAGVCAWSATRNSTHDRILRFFRILLLGGLFEGLLGLFQYFVNPGWIFGYINPFYRSSGTLINHNHFAGLLEMLIPLGFGLAYVAMDRHGGVARAYLYLLAATFMGLSLLFSMSRMGIFSFLATVFFVSVVLQFRKSHQRVGIIFGLTVAGLVLVAAIWIGADVIVQRYSQLIGEDALLREGRFIIFKDALQMIHDHPFGVGIGKFQDLFRAYQTFRLDLLFDHAHNDYLETAVEWGVPAAVLFWSFLFFTVIRGLRLFAAQNSPEARGIVLTCSASMFSILLHSLADFNLQIPSNAMLFFTFVGVSLAIPIMAGKDGDNVYGAGRRHFR